MTMNSGTKKLVRDLVAVAGAGLVTVLLGAPLMGQGTGDPCTTYYAPCNVDVANCCLAAGSVPHTNTATGQTKSAIPNPPPAGQCARQFTLRWFGCTTPVTGGCGGVAHNSDCT